MKLIPSHLTVKVVHDACNSALLVTPSLVLQDEVYAFNSTIFYFTHPIKIL